MVFLTRRIDFGFEYLYVSGCSFQVSWHSSVPCFVNCRSVLSVLAHMAAPPHTQPYLIPFDDKLELGISMSDFWGER
jgi:hypothetical protein